MIGLSSSISSVQIPPQSAFVPNSIASSALKSNLGKASKRAVLWASGMFEKHTFHFGDGNMSDRRRIRMPAPQKWKVPSSRRIFRVERVGSFRHHALHTCACGNAAMTSEYSVTRNFNRERNRQRQRVSREGAIRASAKNNRRGESIRDG